MKALVSLPIKDNLWRFLNRTKVYWQNVNQRKKTMQTCHLRGACMDNIKKQEPFANKVQNFTCELLAIILNCFFLLLAYLQFLTLEFCATIAGLFLKYAKVFIKGLLCSRVCFRFARVRPKIMGTRMWILQVQMFFKTVIRPFRMQKPSLICRLKDKISFNLLINIEEVIHNPPTFGFTLVFPGYSGMKLAT